MSFRECFSFCTLGFAKSLFTKLILNNTFSTLNNLFMAPYQVGYWSGLNLHYFPLKTSFLWNQSNPEGFKCQILMWCFILFSFYCLIFLHFISSECFLWSHTILWWYDQVLFYFFCFFFNLSARDLKIFLFLVMWSYEEFVKTSLESKTRQHNHVHLFILRPVSIQIYSLSVNTLLLA